METTAAELRTMFSYDPETGLVTRKVDAGNRKAGSIVGTKLRHTYTVMVRKHHYPLGRLIWLLVYGSIPNGFVVDHINGNPFDNRLVNLRAVTQAINSRNLALKKNNSSGYNGIYWKGDKKKWSAEVWVDGRKHWLGYFDTPEAANETRLAAQEQYGFHENHGKRRTLVKRV